MIRTGTRDCFLFFLVKFFSIFDLHLIIQSVIFWRIQHFAPFSRAAKDGEKERREGLDYGSFACVNLTIGGEGGGGKGRINRLSLSPPPPLA